MKLNLWVSIRFVIAIAAIVLAGSCNALPPGLLPNSLDGNWRLVFQAGFGVTCFTIVNNQIVQVDDGCLGRANAIVSNDPALISGDRVLWVFAIQTDNGGVSVITLDVVQQPDSTLVGTATLGFGGGGVGPPTPVVMARN